MKIQEIEQFLKKKKEFFPSDIIQEIEQERVNAIQEKDEEKANLFWRFAVIYYVQNGYFMLYQLLKNRSYAKAWEMLKQTDMQLTILNQNYALDTEEQDPYQLVFIRSMLQEYEKLFPYEYFICRESVVRGQRCSICGETVKLRGGCGHVPGKVYMGELCVHEAVDFDYLNTKIVMDPFDKFEILQPYQSDQLNYNFGLLEGVMGSLKSPYEYWEVEIVKEKNPEYARIGRNDRCPCGSGRKFKHCCMNDEEKMYFDHYKIRLLNDAEDQVSQPLKMI